MNKPLELTAYPLDLGFPSGYALPRDTRITFATAERMALEKRFTQAELAAEYWKSRHSNNIRGPVYDSLEYDSDVMYRFATLPHYDEGQP